MSQLRMSPITALISPAWGTNKPMSGGYARRYSSSTDGSSQSIVDACFRIMQLIGAQIPAFRKINTGLGANVVLRAQQKGQILGAVPLRARLEPRTRRSSDRRRR
jgi:hypothetical protein